MRSSTSFTGRLGQEGAQGGQRAPGRGLVFLAAEAAAEAGHVHFHLVHAQAQHVGRVALHGRGPLRGGNHAHAAHLRGEGVGALRFDVQMLLPAATRPRPRTRARTRPRPPAESPIWKVRGGTISSPWAAATRGSVMTGSGVDLDPTWARAAWACALDAASTRATGWPRKCTCPSASRGSSGTMPPIWLVPGISAAVSDAHHAGQPQRRA